MKRKKQKLKISNLLKNVFVISIILMSTSVVFADGWSERDCVVFEEPKKYPIYYKGVTTWDIFFDWKKGKFVFSNNRVVHDVNAYDLVPGFVWIWTKRLARWEAWSVFSPYKYPLVSHYNLWLSSQPFDAVIPNSNSGSLTPNSAYINSLFPDGCSDLSSQQPDQAPNLDTGKPECNDQGL